ncbi:MAG: hypothetical protein ACOC8D_01115 [bacterium]
MLRVLMLLLAAVPALAAEGRKKPVLAVLDFVCREGDLGARFATRLNKRLLQANRHVLFDRYDLGLAVKDAGLQVHLKGNEKAIQTFAREQLGADLVLWGAVERRDEGGFHVAVRCMRTDGPPKPYLDVAKDVANLAFFTRFYKEFEPILLGQRKTLRTLHPVDPQRQAVNLVKNPSFERGTWTPAHWSKLDGLTSHWLDRADGKGKCVLCDTDVDEKQALAWMKQIQAGKVTARDAPEKIDRKVAGQYGTIGAWEGVQVYSDFIPVKPTMRYRLSVDIKANWGGIFFPKAFIKGYADQTDEFTTQKRELYRAYLALRTKTRGKEWETFTRTFNPTLETPRVRYIRVMLYSYWPLGKYYWDNVAIAEAAIED